MYKRQVSDIVVATAVQDNTGYLQGPVAVMGLCLETKTLVPGRTDSERCDKESEPDRLSCAYVSHCVRVYTSA